jgi:hypothetical protein
MLAYGMMLIFLQDAPESKSLTIHIRNSVEGDVFFVGKKRLDEKQLERELRKSAESEHGTVLILAGPDVSTSSMTRVLEICKEVGVEGVELKMPPVAHRDAASPPERRVAIALNSNNVSTGADITRIIISDSTNENPMADIQIKDANLLLTSTPRVPAPVIASDRGLIFHLDVNKSCVASLEVRDGAGTPIFTLDEEGNIVRVRSVTASGSLSVGGDLTVGGMITKGGGSFVIDHPLDPENRILVHSFVESPEMVNVYKGRARLTRGEATVHLPSYFEALNGPDGREVFLTGIGDYSPLFVEGEIHENQFVVKTKPSGRQDQEFSWMVMAVRGDPFARSHPIVVEQEKGVGNRFERGRLLTPQE